MTLGVEPAAFSIALIFISDELCHLHIKVPTVRSIRTEALALPGYTTNFDVGDPFYFRAHVSCSAFFSFGRRSNADHTLMITVQFFPHAFGTILFSFFRRQHRHRATAQ